MFLLWAELYACESRCGAWFADCAQIWFCNAAQLPSKSGHLFSSLQAVKGQAIWLARNSGYRNEDEYWKIHWLAAPGSRCFLSPPLYFPSNSLCLDQVADTALFAMHLQPPTSFFWLWNMIVSKIHANGLSLDVLPPDSVTPHAHAHRLLFDPPRDPGIFQKLYDAFGLEQVPWLWFTAIAISCSIFCFWAWLSLINL